MLTSTLQKSVKNLSLTRFYKLFSTTSVADVQVYLEKCHMEVQVPSTSRFTVDYMWLRDHCRCSTCFNSATQQRAYPLLQIPSDIKPLTCQANHQQLTVQWSDNHTSKYPLTWLIKFCDHQNQQNGLQSLYKIRKFWTEHSPPITPELSFEELKNSGVQIAVESILKNGFVTITKVPSTVEATQQVVESIAPVQHTFFGSMWEFGPNFSNDKVHDDTAYSSEALDPHNDSTYFTESTGLQVFHCLGRSENNKGGETLLVDGMAAVNELSQTNPKSYKLLSTIPIESEYKEEGKHYLHVAPIIVKDPLTSNVLQVRFNLYDRAPMRTIANCDIREYYNALRDLSTIILDGRYTTKLMLHPGTVLIIDNWRVLHGRTEFQGHRHMAGCYVTRSDWLSKARLFGLIC